MSVDENIQMTKNSINNLKEEILRLEGTLRVFDQLKVLGVSQIAVGEDDDTIRD